MNFYPDDDEEEREDPDEQIELENGSEEAENFHRWMEQQAELELNKYSE